MASVAPPAVRGDRLKSIEEMLAESRTPPPPPQPKVDGAARRPAVIPPQQPIRMASATPARQSTAQGGSSRRFWVQLASGPNSSALPGEFRRIQRRHPDTLADLKPYVADEAQRSRLLVGPFKDKDAALEFAEGLESDGVNAFSWTAPVGQTVRKLPSE